MKSPHPTVPACPPTHLEMVHVALCPHHHLAGGDGLTAGAACTAVSEQPADEAVNTVNFPNRSTPISEGFPTTAAKRNGEQRGVERCGAYSRLADILKILCRKKGNTLNKRFSSRLFAKQPTARSRTRVSDCVAGVDFDQLAQAHPLSFNSLAVKSLPCGDQSHLCETELHKMFLQLV